jgi:hypothetical protein
MWIADDLDAIFVNFDLQKGPSTHCCGGQPLPPTTKVASGPNFLKLNEAD